MQRKKIQQVYFRMKSKLACFERNDEVLLIQLNDFCIFFWYNCNICFVFNLGHVATKIFISSGT